MFGCIKYNCWAFGFCACQGSQAAAHGDSCGEGHVWGRSGQEHAHPTQQGTVVRGKNLRQAPRLRPSMTSGDCSFSEQHKVMLMSPFRGRVPGLTHRVPGHRGTDEPMGVGQCGIVGRAYDRVGFEEGGRARAAVVVVVVVVVVEEVAALRPYGWNLPSDLHRHRQIRAWLPRHPLAPISPPRATEFRL
ncbi:unnamed protein product [Gadus morhua 'NCC']